MPRSPTEADPRSRRRAVAPRRRPAAEDDVGRLRVRHGFPQEARPRLHARGPDLHRARAERSSSRAPASTATRRCTCRTRSRRRRPDQGLRAATTRCRTPRRARTVTHRIACIDCHDPDTMELRVTRPGFIEGIRALQGRPGREGLRREHDGHAPGDAHASSAASATSSTTSRARRSASPIRGPRA